MTQLTPNLSLVLYNSTTDAAATFAAFRADLAGISGTSNFSLIDTAYGSLDARVDILELIKSAVLVDAAFISANYYEATQSLIPSYATGMSILLKLDTDSAGTVTLKINSLATLNVMKVDSTGTPVNMSAGELQSGRYYLFIYDGSRWVWADATSADQVYHSGTAGNVVLVASDASISDSKTPSLLLSDTITAATAKTTPVDADVFGISDSAASGVLKKLSWTNIKATLKTYFDTLYQAAGSSGLVSNGQEGFVDNAVITPSISSNNLTVAIKTVAGTDPQSSDAVTIRIGNSKRTLSGALSVTVNAGTNTFNLGATEFLGLKNQLFVYLGWMAASSTIFIGLSRYNHGKTYADFSTTATSEGYLSYSGSAPASTDEVELIGRIDVQNSGTASFNWSLPSGATVINRPIYHTDWITYTSVQTGFSSNPTNTNYQYLLTDRTVFWQHSQGTNGTSNSTSFTQTLPFTCGGSTLSIYMGTMQTTVDNGVILTTPGRCSTGGTLNTLTINKDVGGNAFTASGGKRAHNTGFYQI